MESAVAVSEEKETLIDRSYRGHDGKEEASSSNSVDVDFRHLPVVVYLTEHNFCFLLYGPVELKRSRSMGIVLEKVNDERAYVLYRTENECSAGTTTRVRSSSPMVVGFRMYGSSPRLIDLSIKPGK
jgi:hypothetical protein